MERTKLRRFIAASCIALPMPSVMGQQAPSPAPAEVVVTRPGATGLLQVKADDLPPQLKLGYRVEQVRRATRVIPVVVIVRDAPSFLAAIASWTPQRRFPVLVDDGTLAAREDIGRFVRAFRPARVVRWKDQNPGSIGGWTNVDKGAVDAALAQSLSRMLPPNSGEAVTPGTPGQLASIWKNDHPPGIIVASGKDPAWTAALAIAAFRGEPILWRETQGSLADVFGGPDADTLCADIEKYCESLAKDCALKWAQLGDDIDAITLCLNCPAKLWVTSSDVAATTDRVGRAGTTAAPGARWAWCGQIFGTSAQASYRAACALFLNHTSAWLFDGYTNDKGFADYDLAPAAEALRGIGMKVQLDDAPAQGVRDWRARASKAIDADLILVNTKGNSDFFELVPGIARPGDVPLLERPAAVHFTHSWSAQWPVRHDTVAGRWFEHGVYAYVGSVQEPYLQAFVQPKALAPRLIAGGPWGVCARMDAGPFAKVWKIAVFGDPLIVLGDPLAREDAPLPLFSGEDLAASLPTILKQGKYAESIDTLALLGRDTDIRRIVEAMRQESNAALTSQVIAKSMLSVFRTGTSAQVVDFYSLLSKQDAGEPLLRDALWLACAPLLEDRPDAKVLDTLRANLREDQIEHDATDLARAWAIQHDRASAVQMLQELRPRYTDSAQKQALERAIAAFRNR